jgi:phosphoserine phosphatase RsbU/P
VSDDDQRAIARISEALRLLGTGAYSEPIAGAGSEALQSLAALVNQVIAHVRELNEYVIPLAAGDLKAPRPGKTNFLAAGLKELHSRLGHLTWQAQQVAQGDYQQRLDFMGDFSDAFNAMIVMLEDRENRLKAELDARTRAQAELAQRMKDLEAALAHVRTLQGMLPICMYCHKIRTDAQVWQRLESYIMEHSDATFTHGMCPQCAAKHWSEPESPEPSR